MQAEGDNPLNPWNNHVQPHQAEYNYKTLLQLRKPFQYLLAWCDSLTCHMAKVLDTVCLQDQSEHEKKFWAMKVMDWRIAKETKETNRKYQFNKCTDKSK